MRKKGEKVDYTGFACFQNDLHGVTILARSVYTGKCTLIALSAFLKTTSLDDENVYCKISFYRLDFFFLINLNVILNFKKQQVYIYIFFF